MDRLPDWTGKEILASKGDDLAYQIPAAAIRDRGHGGHPPALEDNLQIGNRILDDQVDAIGRHAPTLPFGIAVGFTVKFKIAHTGAQKGVDLHHIFDIKPAWVGRRPVNAHHGHKAFGQQQLGKVECPIMVIDFEPFHAEGAQFWDPEITDLAHTDRCCIAGRPVDANACIISRAGIFV